MTFRTKNGQFSSSREVEKETTIEITIPWKFLSYAFVLMLVFFIIMPWIGLFMNRLPIFSYLFELWKFFLNECESCKPCLPCNGNVEFNRKAFE